jgi:acetyl-CoA C-acetyltransferase
MKAVIVSGKRTAIGAFGGALKDCSSIDLTASLAKEILRSTGIDNSRVNEVIIGQVLQAGLGQNPARQVVITAGSTGPLRRSR